MVSESSDRVVWMRGVVAWTVTTSATPAISMVMVSVGLRPTFISKLSIFTVLKPLSVNSKFQRPTGSWVKVNRPSVSVVAVRVTPTPT